MPVTVATAVEALRERLDEKSESQWEDKQLRRWLNEGIRDLARRTRLYQDQAEIDVTANIGEYTLDEDILAIEHLLWKPDAETLKRPLEPRAFEGVQRYINETGADPVFYTTYGHAPLLKVQLWPIPTRAGTLYFYGPMLPTQHDINTGSGNIDAITGWYEATLDYAEYMALRKDRQEIWKDIFVQYEAKVQQMIELSATDDAPGEIQFTGTSLVPRWLSEFD
jgi:hypothetical protein